MYTYDKPRRPLTLQVSPGNYLLAPAQRSDPVLAPQERVWHPFFVRPKKIILIKSQGKSMEQKLLEIVQVTVLFHTDEFLFIWSFKNGNERQCRFSGAKTWLLRRAGAKT